MPVRVLQRFRCPFCDGTVARVERPPAEFSGRVPGSHLHISDARHRGSDCISTHVTLPDRILLRAALSRGLTFVPLSSSLRTS